MATCLLQTETHTITTPVYRLILRSPSYFTSDEWSYARQLIYSNNRSELERKYGNYIYDETALSLAITAGADDVVSWILNKGVRSINRHLKEAAIHGRFHLFSSLIESGADIHFNDDEILFYITAFYNKPYYIKTKKELPDLIAKYNLQKTSKNCGFSRDEFETLGSC
jgi:hypothetical protein